VRLRPKSSVLIVDRSAESREVLKTALERLGMRIFEAAGLEDGLKLARAHRLDLIVLDLEAAEPSESAAGGMASDFTGPIRAAASDTVSRASDLTLVINNSAARPISADDFAAARNPAMPTPMVLLGIARRRASLPAGHAGQFVAKPYHYGPLILKIEQMLKKGKAVSG
jgi:CheY-like chemotaxis protein